MATAAQPVFSRTEFIDEVLKEYENLLIKYRAEIEFLLDTITNYSSDNRIDNFNQTTHWIFPLHRSLSSTAGKVFDYAIIAKQLLPTKTGVTRAANGMFANVYCKLLLYNYSFLIGKYLVGKGTANSDYIVKMYKTWNILDFITVAVKDTTEIDLLPRDRGVDYEGGNFTETLITEPITLSFDLDYLNFENFDTINDLDELTNKCRVEVSVSLTTFKCNIKDIANKIKSMINGF